MILAHLRAEGAPLHPDDLECDLSDERYLKQMQAYKDFYKLSNDRLGFMVREELREKLK